MGEFSTAEFLTLSIRLERPYFSLLPDNLSAVVPMSAPEQAAALYNKEHEAKGLK